MGRSRRYGEDRDIIVDYKPFIFEDTKEYAFRILDWDSDTFHDLRIYKKKTRTITKTEGVLRWKKTTTYEENYYEECGNCLLYIEDFKSSDNGEKIKRLIERELPRIKGEFIANWDGFVGNIDEGTKQMIIRDNNLKDLLG